ncbi:MAG: membrane dipeptidase [Clostridia bacterium]|nr:membrane dipeptidase [Clostridia bacterium]
MRLLDLHCDTPFELYLKKQKLYENDLHISLKRSKVFDRYIQCAAVWSDSKKSDSECFSDFYSISDYFENEADGLLIKSQKELERAQRGFVLTVEDMRLIDSDISRVKELYDKGVRVGTVMWGGSTSLGASHDAEGGLTPLGKDTVSEMLSVGIIPDISHANDTVSREIIEIARSAKKPAIATHSNSRAVYHHTRNLPDSIAKDIADCGGIIGISLFPPHLAGERADISHILSHLKHHVNIAGENTVCLGCDLDGIGSTPEGIGHIDDLPRVFDRLSKDLGYNAADKIFFSNAYNFFINNLPQKEKTVL